MSAGRIKIGAFSAVASLVIVSAAAAQQATQQPSLQDRETNQRDVDSQIERGQPADRVDRSQPADRAQGARRSAGYRAGGQAAQSQELDKYLATCLMVANQAAIEMNQFGQQQAENPQVKQFAQRLVQEHQQLAQKLQQIAGQQAGQASRQTVGATSQTDTQRTATGTQPSATAEADQSATGENHALKQLASIDREITQRCAALTKQKLQEKQGQEFDKGFVGCQIGEHIGMLAALQVIGQQTSGELAQVAQQAEQKVQQHLQQAEQLMKQLDSGQARATTQQPGN